ncbi:V-type proton ATPase subunit e-like [Cimex lectularius]|uniref:V-type proton ATPase subunit n=1 Tax=Cimex lectularius TaxID=79782 RepID=A0A8I6SC20_CIMLE|nr:V-type proton ATPase subunit e-like [Cimex lectularius]XP_014257076.1 V-type proton ATPase subunit e-like [Cimex lectularius]
MGYSVIPLAVVSGFWAVVGLVVPFFIPKGPNKGIIQWSLVLTAACCWLIYICTYLVQMNPLVGPRIKSVVLMNMAREWGNEIKEG